MATPVTFSLRRLEAQPKMDASLAEASQGVPRIMTARAIPPVEEMTLNSDFNGDGTIDSLYLTVNNSGLDVALQCRTAHCTLFARGGSAGVAKLIPGDLNADGLADFYLETTDGGAYIMENTMDAPIRPLLNRDTYRSHLLGMAAQTLGTQGWWDAVRSSIALTTGLSHTWVAQEPKPRYPWIDGTPLHTDCVIDLERTLAELHNSSGKFSGFQRLFNRIQKYDFKGPERTDFFTAEAVPHLISLGMLRDLTNELWEKASPEPIPTFTATINKEAWYRFIHKGMPSGKDFPVWQRTLRFIPFEVLLALQTDGQIHIRPEIAAALPPVSIFVIMNQGRVFKSHGTEIPDSHVGYLVKDPSTGEIHIHHSTPTTDLGMAAVTSETLSSFFKTRYCRPLGGKLTIFDKTAVGVQLFGFVPPKGK